MGLKKLPKLDKRILIWNQNEFVPRNCPVCGSEGHPKFIRPDGLTVRHCEECFNFFISPAPTREQLSAFYSSYDKNHRNLPKINGDKLRKEFEKTDPNSDYRYRVITSLMKLHGKRVLDVGFGRGFFLYFARQLGAETVGLELDDDAIRYARECLGIHDARKVDLLVLDEHERFDLILLMDLIEHVLEPFEYLKKACSLLNPGGIVVLFTPNASFALEEPEPVLFRVDLEHMQYFSNRTCNYVARKLGLDIVHLENVGLPYLTGLVEEKSAKQKMKSLLAKIPGFESAYRLRQVLTGKDLSRRGRYHLFVAFKRRLRIT